MFFEDILGNDHLKTYLQKALEKQTLANTLLFSGIDGIGKFLFAKALAVKLMSFEKVSEELLKKITDENHPDLHILSPEGKTALHSISSIRELIKQMNLSPFEAARKVFIIKEAHRMLPSSFNALLKTLEEPNLDSYIILLTDKEEDLLPTIISRCFKLKFVPLKDQEIKALLERWGKTSFESKRIALLSQGSVARACEISSFVEDDDKVKIIIDILSKKEMNYLELSQQLEILQKLFEKTEKEEKGSYHFKLIDIIFSHVFFWYRDLHLLKEGIFDEDLFFFSDKINLMKKQNLTKIPNLKKVHLYLSETFEGIERNLKIKTCLENLFFKLKVVRTF